MATIPVDVASDRLLALAEATNAVKMAAGQHADAAHHLALLLVDTSRAYQIGPVALSRLISLHPATIAAYMRSVTGHTDPRLIQDPLFDLPEPQPALPDIPSAIAGQQTAPATSQPDQQPALPALPTPPATPLRHL